MTHSIQRPANLLSSLAPTPAFVAAVAQHPATIATRSAFAATANGIVAIYEFERDNEFGLSVASFIKDIFVQIALPLLSLFWLAVCAVCQQVSNPKTWERIGHLYMALLSRFEHLANSDGADASPFDAVPESGEVM